MGRTIDSLIIEVLGSEVRVFGRENYVYKAGGPVTCVGAHEPLIIGREDGVVEIEGKEWKIGDSAVTALDKNELLTLGLRDGTISQYKLNGNIQNTGKMPGSFWLPGEKEQNDYAIYALEENGVVYTISFRSGILVVSDGRYKRHYGREPRKVLLEKVAYIVGRDISIVNPKTLELSFEDHDFKDAALLNDRLVLLNKDGTEVYDAYSKATRYMWEDMNQIATVKVEGKDDLLIRSGNKVRINGETFDVNGEVYVLRCLSG